MSANETETASVVQVISRMDGHGAWEATATLRGHSSTARGAGPCAAAHQASIAVTAKSEAHRMAEIPEGVHITALYAKDEDVDSYAIFADLSSGERTSIGFSWVTSTVAERMAETVEVPLHFC